MALVNPFFYTYCEEPSLELDSKKVYQNFPWTKKLRFKEIQILTIWRSKSSNHMVENHETYRQGSPICWEIMKCIRKLLTWAFCIPKFLRKWCFIRRYLIATFDVALSVFIPHVCPWLWLSTNQAFAWYFNLVKLWCKLAGPL